MEIKRKMKEKPAKKMEKGYSTQEKGKPECHIIVKLRWGVVSRRPEEKVLAVRHC